MVWVVVARDAERICCAVCTSEQLAMSAVSALEERGVSDTDVIPVAAVDRLMLLPKRRDVTLGEWVGISTAPLN
ncbi:hypothetical protein [Pseudofrankia asymbiotica]|uniref:hypothetical protein n=1 Tax=Pseudofrankia asymbiotica TaxID=1834516 RepID=UPI0013044D3D|nr:hypothetical protein [Pseudofrankia asymbiotica]